MRLCALSVDLDEIPCYTAIHGLPPPAPECARAVYERAVPRFEALFDGLDARATFFAIGSDLVPENGVARAAIARLHAHGHEIGNHTLSHHYDFTRLPEDVMRDEIAGGMRAIEAVTGVRPAGFRSPGYTMTDAVFERLAAFDVAYDSSVFPCPGYYSAKVAKLAAIRVRGRRSHSVLDTPRVLGAPADPYRVGAPYTKRGSGMLELPIGVTRDAAARLPFIGTSLVLAGERGAAWLARQMIGRPLVNLELHGIDLLGAGEDELEFLAPHQFDLRKSLEHKRTVLLRAIWVLRGAGYEFVTLQRAAEIFGQAL
jgi:peptidoglycan/xylan/chitin deacetylase (PgdA/CDA1 family)